MPRATIPDRANVILDQARAIVLEKGYQHTTIAEIARRAGVGKGAVYLDFPSKEALLDALLVRSARALTQAVRDRVDGSAQPVSLSAVYRFGLEALLGDELMLACYLADDGALGGYLREKGPQRYRPRMEWLSDYVAELSRAGMLRADLDPAVASLVMSVFAVGLANASATVGALSGEQLGRAVESMAGLVATGWEVGGDGDPVAAHRAHSRLLDLLADQIGEA
ncbi:DNA-binding transcriptional regulator, AcrR family [Saccharopolyspora antimicrobica]|uniref:DNA-binding transcriptional regulator, AcrR family n=1 Tax=Saccharopolyspora antimicrobica TaxID=455193 RepID=A0A1I4RER3_9PSEU|nr:TetR/AcrR family transcriptional regulator [Saccharopolyspora antimicrobica]RKT88039.1 TetR family transcriptional regulator [Saccharopolyspora antimicrobica]SFM50751.1 DNA-binding transcriptional regulator, AcrR family [Saccharopolyspora antimicrobica]